MKPVTDHGPRVEAHSKRQLTLVDYRDSAEELRCEVAALRAVAEVEAPGGGFLGDGRLRVLFEGHVFYRETKGAFHDKHPTLCFPKWTREHYARGKDADARGAGELARLDAAMKLHRRAALSSASFGKFQIMGGNYKECLYPNVEEFYRGMGLDEQAQLLAYCQFIRSTSGMLQALRDREWAKFARLQNGAAYKKNDYDGKLARAYQKLAA